MIAISQYFKSVEGWKVVYRVILALLEYAQDHLMELDMEGILTL